ncbi:uncharacterized protein LOC127282149 [Leptopilina boulardi]|uniref:uncharacterized protein LOC127282149 n=1 Tax=Leptopilina boulardi TaxID=63433 RepID=UPI0021F5E0AC|nr:uncharacterized protein LOC127282149 [Leptopilina boulardi]
MNFSSNEAIDAVEFWDKTVELIGYISNIIPRRIAGKSECFKFYLNNNNGKKIQCVVWGKDDIDILERKIIKNSILHIDGGCARVPSKPEYNYGNVRYELQLSAKTMISQIGMHTIEDDASFDLSVISLADVIHHEGERIKVFGYLKSKFIEEKIGTLRNIGTYGCGSITDGKYKMEVRIANFKNKLNCNKGDPLHLIGQINTQGARIFLQLQTEEDIEMLEERGLSLTQVIDGFREMKRVNSCQITKENSEISENGKNEENL